MTKRLIIGAALAGSLFAMQPAFAQSGYVIEDGATVGMVPGIAPGVAIIAPDMRPRFRSYVIERNIPSYEYRGPVAIGDVVPERGVTYYQVPSEYGASDYLYTVINNQPVLIDPSVGRIVDVIGP